MNNDLKGVYFAKNTSDGTFQDITTLFDGVRVLQVSGVAAKGKAVNVYNEQWIDSQQEDFMITTNNGVIIRENVDIEITFLVHQRYATSTIDVKTQHDLFVAFLTNTDVWIKTAYQNDAIAHCVCLDGYEPTTMKLKRDSNTNYALGTIKLHCLDAIQQDND